MNTADSETPKIRIGIADDHLVVRDALARMLDEAGCEVRFASASVDDTVAAMGAEPVDVLLLDLCLRGHDAQEGIRLLESLRESHPRTHVVVLTGADGEELASASMAAGASAYVTKTDSSMEALLDAVRAAARGERRVPVDLVARQGGLAASRPIARDRKVLATLTDRERQVLTCVAEGADNLKISAQLGIAERTVKAHVSSLYRKLGVENRVQLALAARKWAVALDAPPSAVRPS